MTGIVILNYNSAADVEKCVGMLRQQTAAAEMEIIVVDNASEAVDRARVAALCEAEGLRFIAADCNRGYSAGNNLGIAEAIRLGCDAVMIANPDMEFPQRDYVYRLRDTLFSQPDYAVAASCIVGPDDRAQNPMKEEGGWQSSFAWIGELLLRRRHDFIDRPTESHDCLKVSGSCLMLRTDFLKSIGLFDSTPFLYCEEAILSRQVASAGMKMRYDASISAIHRHIPSAKGDPRPRFRHWRRSRIYYIKHYSGWPLAGRLAAILSMHLYTSILISGASLKRLLRR